MLPLLTPTDFVALANQTLEFAYPSVEIEGEVKNFKVSRGRWVYFDIADEAARIRCFGTVYMLPAPVEDGMKVRIMAAPRLHPQFGFSLNLLSLQFSGEGTIKKAANLLRANLEKEGLFAPERKRALPYPPERIGLITSDESAAYKDFIKVLSARFGGIDIELGSVQVQGDAAVGQIARAIEWFNRQAETPDVLVIIRGGGSADDLQAFSSEQVTRAVAASRIPTLVAIGHETDVSLAELAADMRASTPSNAAELLVPDRKDILKSLDQSVNSLHQQAEAVFSSGLGRLSDALGELSESASKLIAESQLLLTHQERTLEALSPRSVLKRGYAVVRHEGRAVRTAGKLKSGDILDIQFADDNTKVEVQ